MNWHNPARQKGNLFGGVSIFLTFIIKTKRIIIENNCNRNHSEDAVGKGRSFLRMIVFLSRKESNEREILLLPFPIQDSNKEYLLLKIDYEN